MYYSWGWRGGWRTLRIMQTQFSLYCGGLSLAMILDILCVTPFQLAFILNLVSLSSACSIIKILKQNTAQQNVVQSVCKQWVHLYF